MIPVQELQGKFTWSSPVLKQAFKADIEFTYKKKYI